MTTGSVHYLVNGRMVLVDELTESDLTPGAFAQRHAHRLGDVAPPSRSIPRHPTLTTPELDGKGFFGWNPDGTIMLRVLEQWLRALAQRIGGDEVITPTLHRPSASPVADFTGRQFVTELSNDGDLVQLRHGADYAHLALLRGRTSEATQHPVRIWEYGSYFRRYRSGEIGGLAKIREFHMLDHHTLCAPEVALGDFVAQVREQVRALEDFPFTAAVELTVVADKHPAVAEAIAELSRDLASPLLVEVIPAHTNTWAVRSYVFVDGPYRTANLQLDRSLAGAGPEPVALIHSSMGSPERLILAMSNVPDRAALPFWMSPTQVRLFSIGEATAETNAIAAALADEGGFRIDVDEREEPLGNRIRQCRRDRIPAHIALGPRELSSGRMGVTHGKSQSEPLTVAGVLAKLTELQREQPLYSVARPTLETRSEL